MTIEILTGTVWALKPVNGFSSVIIDNPIANASALGITQRAVVPGASEEADPTTDPGYQLAPGKSISLNFAQTIFLVAPAATQHYTVVPIA